MFSLICPIQKKYFSPRGTCLVNQFFGENGNDFYRELGLLGHNGIDFATKFWWKRIYNWSKKMFPTTDDTTPTDKDERDGIIPIFAAHNGYLSVTKNESRTKGIYMVIESDDIIEDGIKVKYQTMYFHLDRVTRWKGDGLKWGDKPANFVAAGSIIGFTDNTGEYTTGSHLHFGLYKYIWTPNGYVRDSKNGYDGAINPLPYFWDGTIFESNVWIGEKEYYQNGRKIIYNPYKK